MDCHVMRHEAVTLVGESMALPAVAIVLVPCLVELGFLKKIEDEQ
jgi:hypothetical protein